MFVGHTFGFELFSFYIRNWLWYSPRLGSALGAAASLLSDTTAWAAQDTIDEATTRHKTNANCIAKPLEQQDLSKISEEFSKKILNAEVTT